MEHVINTHCLNGYLSVCSFVQLNKISWLVQLMIS